MDLVDLAIDFGPVPKHMHNLYEDICKSFTINYNNYNFYNLNLIFVKFKNGEKVIVHLNPYRLPFKIFKKLNIRRDHLKFSAH